MAMRCTLVFPYKEGRVWLAAHKRGPLTGKLNGYGGKIEPHDDSAREGACREFAKESGATIYPGWLRYITTIVFYRGGERFVECLVYFVSGWEGEFKETEEMGLPEPYPVENLPYERMMPGDYDWVPKLFNDIRFRATVYYDEDLKILEKIEYHDC